MKHDLFINRSIFVASLFLIPLFLPMGSSAAEPEMGTRALQTQNLKQIAVGSTQDSLKACLARIPEDASVGQRMLAEQGCQQVDVDRAEEGLTF